MRRRKKQKEKTRSLSASHTHLFGPPGHPHGTHHHFALERMGDRKREEGKRKGGVYAGHRPVRITSQQSGRFSLELQTDSHHSQGSQEMPGSSPQQKRMPTAATGAALTASQSWHWTAQLHGHVLSRHSHSVAVLLEIQASNQRSPNARSSPRCSARNNLRLHPLRLHRTLRNTQHSTATQNTAFHRSYCNGQGHNRAIQRRQTKGL